MNARELRRRSKENRGIDRQPCFVCGRHESITELHHVFTLKDCVMVFDIVQSVEVPMVWLCPNCHTYIHQMYKGKFFNTIREIPEDEYLRMCDLVKQRDDVFTAVIRGVAD